MDDRISLKIDLKSGLIEIDAPAERFRDAITQTKELTSTLDFSVVNELPAPNLSPPAVAQSTDSMLATSGSKRTSKAKKSKASKASSGRPGRIGSFEEVKSMLTEPQEIELRDFFTKKMPSEQGHEVLVAIVKGEELLGRRGFNYNEIYTLMWLGGVKDLPKAIDVVLSRLAQEQMIVREENGFAAKFVGRNFVEQDLPKSSSL